MPVEALFPQGRKRFELGSSGWSRVLGIDAVGGSPHCDFADEGGARVASRCSPDWLGVTLAGVVLDLVGEVGDQLGSLCQVASPDGIGIERCWNAREPWQRTWVGRRERWQAPVEDGGHVACGSEVATAAAVSRWRSGCFPVSAARASRWARRVGQAGSVGESGDVLVGLVELSDGLGSDELFGCDVEAVGVALDRLEQPGRWIA